MSAPRRAGLAGMLRAGVAAIAGYTGTFFALFAAQVLVVAGTGFVTAELLAAAFATRPMFDDGVDGDVAALVEALRHADQTIAAVRWTVAGGILLWLVLSWLLVAGLINVLAERPSGRAATARSFGGGAAGSFFVLVRLGVISVVMHGLVLFVAALGLGAVYPRIETAMSVGPVIGALLLGLAPAFVLLLFLWTVLDYARIELVVRRQSHDRLGAALAFARAFVFVLRRPITLAHTALWALAFLAVSALYVWASFDAEMVGTSGAIALLIVREGVAMARMALRVILVGGQVELGGTRPAPTGALTREP